MRGIVCSTYELSNIDTINEVLNRTIPTIDVHKHLPVLDNCAHPSVEALLSPSLTRDFPTLVHFDYLRYELLSRHRFPLFLLCRSMHVRVRSSIKKEARLGFVTDSAPASSSKLFNRILQISLASN